MKKLNILLIICLIQAGSHVFAQVPNYVPLNNLIGWWPFNGNANDESGNGNNGTVNGATLTADRFGVLNSALSFDGIDDFVEMANAFSDWQDFSFSMWLNHTKGNAFSGLISDANSFPSNDLFLNVNQSSVGLKADKSGSTLFNCYLPEVNYPNPSLVNNQNFQGDWKHLVLSKGGNTLYLFLNGNMIQSFTVSASNVGYHANNPVFGKLTDGAYSIQYMQGYLDDIGIWNRALTECEIQDLYNAQLNSASLSISAGADQSICAGDNVTLSGAGGSNYQWNNNVVDGQAFAPTQSSAYVVNGTDTLGCQGTDTVVVTVLENATSTLTETALDSYTLNGQTYTQSGTYTQTLTALNGCDSTITLNLTLNFTGMDELGTGAKKLIKITDLNGKIIPRRKNTLMLFIYEDGTVERVVEMEE